MKKIKKAHIFIYLTGIAFFFYSCNQDEINPEQVREFSIYSSYTDSDYKIWVVLPDNYDPNLTYETVYVLDANAFYLAYGKVAKMTEEKSRKYGKRNAIVVGIDNNGAERNRDFTPTFVAGEGDGGSENYSKFIQFELIPKMESDFPVDVTAKSRVIVGHSYGGLFTCYLFTKHPNIFHNYITLSASTFYDNDLLFQYETNTRASNSAINNLVFIGCGELEEGIVIRSKEWKYRLSTFYPNCKTDYNKAANRFHSSSALENAEIGIDFYYKN